MLCKFCGIECEYNEPRMRKGMILKHRYYYSYRYKCLKCLRWYYPPEAIRYYDQVEKEVEIVSGNVVELMKEAYEGWTRKSELKRQRKVIHVFRQYYLDNPNAFYNKSEKLSALLYLSTLVFPMKAPLPEQRKVFDEKKADPIWQRHINAKKCFLCFSPAQVRHHMILLKNGGRNVYSNIITLCRPCHAEIHPWLKSTN